MRPWRPFQFRRIRKPCDARPAHPNGRPGGEKYRGRRIVRRRWPNGEMDGWLALLHDVVGVIRTEEGVE